MLQDGLWAIYSSAVTETFRIGLLLSSLIVDGRICNLTCVSGIYKLVLLDLASSRLSLVDLLEVEFQTTGMSLANDSGVHFIHVKGSQLHIWLCTMDKNFLPNWLLIDTICLREICANHMIPTSMFEAVGDSALVLNAVGVHSGFLFLEKNDVLYLFDIKHKAAKKVYEVTQEDKYLYRVRPFMMVWPPKFPIMKGRCARSKKMTSLQGLPLVDPSSTVVFQSPLC